MKRLLIAASLIACLAIGACASTGVVSQAQFVDKTARATQLVDQVTLAAEAAVKANVLKGSDAANTLAGVKTARDGLNLAKTMTPAQGATKIDVTIALLTATQAYLATLKATP